MKRSLSLLFLLLYLAACRSSVEDTTTENTNITATNTDKKTEVRYFPSVKGTVRFDTVIAAHQLRIVITNTNLDTYVERQYEQNIDRYRDVAVTLRIMRHDSLLIDTTLLKEQFEAQAGKEALKNMIIQLYSLRKVSSDTVEFIGSICEPETDNALDFCHYYYVKGNKLAYHQLNNDEE